MSSGKRKKYTKDIKCLFFPDDVKNGTKKVGRDPSLPSTSVAKCWERWGDSFLDTPVLKNLNSSGRKLSAVRKLQSPLLAQTSANHCEEDSVHIAWSSSESDPSGNESEEQPPRNVAREQHAAQRPRKSAARFQSYSRALHMLSRDQGDLPIIDTDSDLNDSEDEVEKSDIEQISDCESESFDKTNEISPKSATDLEISGYVTDEGSGDRTAQSRLDTEGCSLHAGEGSKRSVSHWVRSAQAMLQTPQKPLGKQSRSPEDSTKKKRKLKSGGLAERLNRLQCRQRSAISFWRHQSISETSMATVDRPGVLVLAVLEVHEECGMQLAQCELQQPAGEGHPDGDPPSAANGKVLVLFNTETAAQLMPAPNDILHIYPPWQCLSIQGKDCTIILNTHFSQKVYSDSKLTNMATSRALLPAERGMPYSLTNAFGLQEVYKTPEEHGNTAERADRPQTLLGCPGATGTTGRCHDSLLEAIERLGQAGSVGQDVAVVVQRVYSIHVPDRSAGPGIKAKVPFRSSADTPLQEGRARLCALVQDVYGMFSVIQLHALPSADHVHQYRQSWQGKACVLRGVKVVQRVTRERCTRLFQLIDSLWPPVMPPHMHGNTPGAPSECRAPGPAPGFCYLLSGQERSVEAIEEQAFSPHYFPPAETTLRDVLQNKHETHCCSFVGTVIYKRMQSSDVDQGDVWLVLTDLSLQEGPLEGPCRRTVAVCVSTSCVLTSSVVKALHFPTACLHFCDALKEHDTLLCVEQTVVRPAYPVEPVGSVERGSRSESSSSSSSPPQPVAMPRAHALPLPVRLDPLGPHTAPNSLCTLTGVIVGVDETTAYSWPTCSFCGSDHLEMAVGKPQAFHCVSCTSTVEEPTMKMQLEVFLTSSPSKYTVKAKLQQSTIKSILNVPDLLSKEFPDYEIENVLGKEVGPLAAYVRVITRKPALWISVEEICL